MNEQMVIPYVVSNSAAVALLVLAWFRPALAKWLIGLGFIAAGHLNMYMVVRDPSVYLAYGATAWPIYKDFISTVFAHNIPVFVLSIAFGQMAVGFLTLLKGRLFEVGIIDAMLFLVAIAPLGVGSAFPSTLIMAIAAGMVLKYERYEQKEVKQYGYH